jgi:hypothetical protein
VAGSTIARKPLKHRNSPAADGKGTPTIAEIVDGLLPLAEQKLLNFEAKGELYPERLRRPKPVDPIPTFVEDDSKEVSKQLGGIESLKPWSVRKLKAMVTYTIDEGHVVKPNTGDSKPGSSRKRGPINRRTQNKM